MKPIVLMVGGSLVMPKGSMWERTTHDRSVIPTTPGQLVGEHKNCPNGTFSFNPRVERGRSDDGTHFLICNGCDRKLARFGDDVITFGHLRKLMSVSTVHQAAP